MRLSLIFLATIAIFFSACLDGDDNDVTEVVRISLDNDLLRRGEATVLRVGISYSEDDVFDDGDNVAVVIRLPIALSFVRGTAEIQGIFGDEDVGAQIFTCPSGEDYLLFDLDDDDLRGSDDPSGDSDSELSLTVRADEIIDEGIISARASRNSSFSGCDNGFLFDVETLVTVD